MDRLKIEILFIVNFEILLIFTVRHDIKISIAKSMQVYSILYFIFKLIVGLYRIYKSEKSECLKVLKVRHDKRRNIK